MQEITPELLKTEIQASDRLYGTFFISKKNLIDKYFTLNN